jgi:hypothetical protein
VPIPTAFKGRQMRNVQALIRVFLLQKKIKRIKEKIKKINILIGGTL